MLGRLCRYKNIKIEEQEEIGLKEDKRTRKMTYNQRCPVKQSCATETRKREVRVEIDNK
jgi:hypothetical protein